MFNNSNFIFSSESVTEGHPDKVCDQISDAVLDELIKQDTKSRVACEAFITIGLVIIGGEISTRGYADVAGLARGVIKDIGYTHSKYGFNYDTCAVLNAIGEQSPDIAQGVDVGGAGDQGIMFGYAIDETDELMPMPITLAHKLTMRLSEVRRSGLIGFLGPDGKSQVSVEYRDGKAAHIESVVVSTQHTSDVLDETGERISEDAKNKIFDLVIKPSLPKNLIDDKTTVYINPTGKFVIGGPQSDTGMTGRKLIVDTYGGWAPHGGGAYSGKDPTKVDRSASYMSRYIAKNIVAAGLAKRCTIQLAYAIGVEQPVSFAIDTEGTGVLPDERLEELVKKNFDLTPKGIIQTLDLLRPIYKKTAAYGHFGRNLPEFSWERTDRAAELKSWS